METSRSTSRGSKKRRGNNAQFHGPMEGNRKGDGIETQPKVGGNFLQFIVQLLQLAKEGRSAELKKDELGV